MKHNPNQSRTNIENYIKNSTSDTLLSEERVWASNSLKAYLIDTLPENIKLDNILTTVERTLPDSILSIIDSIYIGDFEELRERDIQSMWKNGAIYTTNNQENDMDMIEDIIHEFAHAIEDVKGLELYSDQSIETEFLQKRRHLYDILLSHGLADNIEPFMSTAYDIEFDKYLHETVGYEKLEFLTMGLFVTPYSATALREYWAEGFEEYYMPSGDRTALRQMSPAIYSKIEELNNE